MDTIDIILKRKSVRCYKDEQICNEDLEKIIASGNNAPNAGPFHISVIQNKDLLQKISDLALEGMKKSGSEFLMSRAALPGYAPIYGAPTLLILSSPKGDGAGDINTSCAAANMTIAATALGLGSCYVVTPGLAFNLDNSLYSEAGIPDGYDIRCSVILGYCAGDEFATEKAPKSNVNYVK